MNEAVIMAKKGDKNPDLYKYEVDLKKNNFELTEDGSLIKNTKVVASRRRASANYDEGQDKIIVRLKSGGRDKVNEYVKANKDKYPSVNAMIKTLLEKEMQTEL